MHNRHLGTLARFSALLVLPFTLACSSGSSGGSGGQGGAEPGSGGSGTGGDNAGSGGSADSGGSARSGGNAGSGGSARSGGVATGTGGSTASGGTTARGGRTGRGGGTGSGGTRTGSGGAAAGTGGTTGGSSSFTVSVELSTAIPTVGIATWSLDAPIDSATIDFGRDESSFELQAPVDLEADKHRTLLLGMKQNTTYYVRVTASGGGQTYVSKVASIKTGSLSDKVPVATVTDHNADALYAGGGFTVLCMGWASAGGPGVPTGGATGSWAFILDPDGDVVWAYDLSKTVAPQCTRARMSLDGKYMWANNFGNTTPDGALARIAMDGLGTPDGYPLPGSNHDFAILPNDNVVYIVRDNGGSGMQPESLFELDPSTKQTKLIYKESTDFGDVFDTRGGHTNQVNYAPELKAISFSMYFINTIGLVSYPEGKLLAAFGGKETTFSTMSWTGQHGHDVYPDHIVIFNNEGTNGAQTFRFKYDLTAKTATEEASYSCGLTSRALGDVKELPNGNYFVTYSMIGTMHEIDSSMKLLREIDTGGTSVSYAEHRASLYGPPPPYDR